MRLLLLFAWLPFVAFAASAQPAAPDSICLAFNTSECVNCYVAARMLLAEYKDQKTIFLFRERDRRYAPAFLHDQLGVNIQKARIRISDKLYKKYAGDEVQSQVVLFYKGQHYRTSIKAYMDPQPGLEPLPDKQAKSFNAPPPTTRVLADLSSIAWSGRPRITSVNEAAVVLHDYTYGRAVAVHSGGEENNRITIYDGQTWTLRQLYGLYFADSTQYTNSLASLREAARQGLAKDQPHIQGATAAHDTVLLLIALPYAATRPLQGQETTFIDTRYLLLTVSGKKMLAAYRLPATLQGTYYFDAAMPVFALGSSFGVGVLKDTLTATNYVFARLQPRGRDLTFAQMLPFQLPAFLKRPELGYQFNEAFLSNNILFYSQLEECYDLARQQTLPIATGVVKPHFSLNRKTARRSNAPQMAANVSTSAQLQDVELTKTGKLEFVAQTPQGLRSGVQGQQTTKPIASPAMPKPLSNVRYFNDRQLIFLDDSHKLVAISR